MSNEESTLELKFYKILNNEIIGIIKPHDIWEVGDFIDHAVAQNILDKISWLLFEKPQDEIFIELAKLNNPSNICGYVFKPGEPTYTCRECAVDPTCVLCHKCFRQSSHKKHKYRLHTSGGGGCCDCGDFEAWHHDPSCTIHNITNQVLNKNLIPPELKRKSEILFKIFFDFMIKLGSNTQNDNIIEDTSDNHVMMVFNDESHTFDYVIQILQKAVPCSESEASDFATIIDREGRTPIRVGSLEDCNIAYNIIEQGLPNFISIARNKPLKGKVIATKHVALQEFSVILMKWVNLLAIKSDGLRNVISEIISCNLNGLSFATSFMKIDTKLWKVARASYQQVFMSTLMLDREYKLKFAVEFTRNYKFLFDQFIEDDHKHTDSITSMSVQIFTVPTIVNHLVEHENLLTILLHSVFRTFGDGFLSVARSPKLNLPKFKPTIRKQFIFYDFKYILCNVPTIWTNEIKEKFLEFFQQFTNMLSVMEGMDGVVRKEGRHLEHDPEWEVGVTLQIRFVTILQHLYVWCGSQLDILLECIRIVTLKLEEHHLKVRRLGSKVNYNGVDFDCYDYDITKEIVSVHYPLTRLLAGLYVEAGKQEHELLQICVNPTNMMEHSLRAMALYVQVAIGAWRRNGLSLSNQTYYMRDSHCRLESLNRDIQMLQACAAAMDPDHFFVALWHKMNLADNDKFDEYMPGLLEDTITLLIYILTERYVQGVGIVTKHDIIKRDIIHILASGPKPYSKISDKLTNGELEIPSWEEILKEVSDFRPSFSSTSVAKFVLKSEYINKVSPFYYNYQNSSEQSFAQTEIIRMKKAKKQSTVFLPTASPQFTKTFEGCLKLLTCSTLINFLGLTLKRCFPDSTQPISWSDKLIEKILYLIGVGIMEEREQVKRNSLTSFNFCALVMNSNQEENLVEILGKLGQLSSMEAHREIITWIANSIDDVINHRLGDVTANIIQPAVLNIDEEEKLRKRAKAKERKLELMREMEQQQKKFLQNINMDEYGVLNEEKDKSVNMETDEVSLISTPDFAVCTSLYHQKLNKDKEFERRVCVLCQDEQTKDCLVMSSFVQRSKVLSKDDSDIIQPIPDVTNGLGLNVSTCSHVMHFQCWNQFFTQLQGREGRRPNILMARAHSYSTSKSEFLCPLCSCLSNCIITVIPISLIVRNYSAPAMELSDWLNQVENENVTLSGATQIEETTRVVENEGMAHALNDRFVEASDLIDDIMLREAENEVEIEDNAIDFDNEGNDGSSGIIGNNVEWFDAMENMEQNEDGFVELKSFLDEIVMPTINTMMQKIGIVSKYCNNDDIYAAVTNTFQVAQYVSAYKEVPLMSQPPIRIEQAHAHIVRCAILLSRTNNKESEIATLLLRENIIKKNLFGVFVNLILKRKGDKVNPVDHDMFCLKICTLAQIVQIMLFIDVKPLKNENQGQHQNQQLVKIFNKVRSYADMKIETNVCGGKLEEVLFKCLNPFIRSCALFMRYVSNVTPCDEMEDRLLFKYLGLSEDLVSYFNENETLENLVKKWCYSVKNMDQKLLFSDLITPNLLMDLPEDYSDVISMASDFVCPRFNKEDDSICPTMCLKCGEILCSRSYCCQQKLDGVTVGACTYHCTKCSAGFGLFLRIRDCTVVLLNGERGSKMAAPYVDEHGETDERLRRGNPLTLDQGRMKELNLIWLTHSIGDNIVRDMEAHRRFVIADWNHY